MAWAGVVALVVAPHPLRRLHHFWLVLLDHVRSQGIPRLEDLVTLSALVDNTGNVRLNVLFHLEQTNKFFPMIIITVMLIVITVYCSLLE